VPFPAKTSTDAIVQAATDLIRAHGLASLSMRTLAARLGVRASSLYRHFPDRSSIERALAKRAGEQLLSAMQHSVEGQSGERALFSAARAYLEYSTAEASFYDILMQPDHASEPKLEGTEGIWAFFVQLVSQSTQFSNDLSGAAALWSFLHGFSVLSRAAQLREATPRLTFARGTQALVRGLSVADAEAVRTPS
jgi:AcrR family transcriptional regulator